MVWCRVGLVIWSAGPKNVSRDIKLRRPGETGTKERSLYRSVTSSDLDTSPISWWPRRCASGVWIKNLSEESCVTISEADAPFAIRGTMRQRPTLKTRAPKRVARGRSCFKGKILWTILADGCWTSSTNTAPCWLITWRYVYKRNGKFWSDLDDQDLEATYFEEN